jgi:hypothetical protein
MLKAGSSKIKHKENNPASNPNTSQRAANNGGGEIPPVDENKLGVLTRDAIGFGACGILAAACFGLEHKIIGLWFSLIALASVLHIPFHYLAKSNPLKKRSIWGSFSLIMGMVLFGCIVLSYQIAHPLLAHAITTNPINTTESKPVEIPHISMNLVTLNGLSSPKAGGTVTGEMVDKYREQMLTIFNPNKSDFRNFKARLQLPEPVAVNDLPPIDLISNIPPSVHVRWLPENSGGSVSGAGQLTVLTNQHPKAEWILEIDSIPATTEINIPFLTVRGNELGITDLDKKLLINFIEGAFQYSTPEGWQTRPLLFPILFDTTNRLMSLRAFQSQEEGKGLMLKYRFEGADIQAEGRVNWFPMSSMPPEASSKQPTIEEQIIRQSQLAQARQWQPPELPPNLRSNPMVQLKFGGMTEVWPVHSEQDAPTAPAAIILPGGGRVVIPYVKDNRIYVKTQTMFGDMEQTVQMNNEWPITIPPGWDRNFNANAFEIVDGTKLPVLQVRYNSANSIEVYGIFVSKNGSVTIAFGDGLKGIAFPFVKTMMPTNIPDRKAWFQYPSSNFLGELAK